MEPHQKAIQLRFRERLGSHTAQGILCGDDKMGLRQRICFALDCNVPLFHSLQKR